MRPLYPRSDFAADPGLVPDTENHKTPHPDAATAPRTADTGASDPINATTPGSTSAVDSYIATLLAPRSGLAAKTGPIPVQWQNPVGGQPLSGGQVFLRNLVGGYNAQAGPRLDDTRSASMLSALLRARREAMGPAADPLLDLKRQHQQAMIDAAEALAKKRSAVPGTDPNADLVRALLEAKIGAENALTRKRGMGPAVRGSRSGGGGKGAATYASERAQINARAMAEMQRRDAALQTVGQAAGWTPEQVTAGRQRMRAEVQAQHLQLLKDLDARYGVHHGEQGGSETPAAQGGTKPSENPNLTPEQRAYWKSKGF